MIIHYIELVLKILIVIKIVLHWAALKKYYYVYIQIKKKKSRNKKLTIIEGRGGEGKGMREQGWRGKERGGGVRSKYRLVDGECKQAVNPGGYGCQICTSIWGHSFNLALDLKNILLIVPPPLSPQHSFCKRIEVLYSLI